MLFRSRELVVIDEFTSVVDRTVAKAASYAVGKAVRARPGRFVAVGCHYDVVDWLAPDWTFEPAAGLFQWRSLRRRPEIAVEIRRASRSAWKMFQSHHYLSGALHRSAKCFLGLVDGRPAAFSAMLPFPHPIRPGWREHRVVCLPDFQGMGIGNAVSEYVCSLFRASGRPVRSVTGSPAMIRRRARSPLWNMTRAPSKLSVDSLTSRRRGASNRFTASFEYVGPARREDAALLGAWSDPVSRRSPPPCAAAGRPRIRRTVGPRSRRPAAARRPGRAGGS